MRRCRVSTPAASAGRPATNPPPVDTGAPAAGRKAVLFATCFVEYNNPGIGRAAQGVLARRTGSRPGSSTTTCCGMPQLERGETAEVCRRARRDRRRRWGSWIDRGWDVIAPIPSCEPDDEGRSGRSICRTIRRWPASRATPATSPSTSSTSPGGEGLARRTGAARRRRCAPPRLPRAGPRTSAPRPPSCCA